MAKGVRAEWENGTKELRSRITDLVGDSDVRNPKMRLVSAFRDVYDTYTVSWNARAITFAALVSVTTDNQDGGGGERLIQVEKEIGFDLIALCNHLIAFCNQLIAFL